VSVVRRGIVALLACALAACSGRGTAPRNAAATVELRDAPSPAPGAGAVETAKPIAALPEGVVVRAEPLPSGVELVIQNRAHAPIELALEASVERVEGGQAASAPVEVLRLDCAPSAPRCVSLVPGAELRAPAWPARELRAQCGASARSAAPTGDYRFGVRACGAQPGAVARLSEPFAVR
jgi:hypothetical protein